MARPMLLAGGNGSSGFVDGNRKMARFDFPAGIALSNDFENLYVCDYGNSALRRVNTRTGYTTTVTSAIPGPVFCAVGPLSGDIYVSCDGDYIARVTPAGVVTILGGSVPLPRGIQINASETRILLAVDGIDFVGNAWVSGYQELGTSGGALLTTSIGLFKNATGGTLAPDGYFYEMCSGVYPTSPTGIRRVTVGTGSAVSIEDYGSWGAGRAGGMASFMRGSDLFLLVCNENIYEVLLAPDHLSVVSRTAVLDSSIYQAWGIARRTSGCTYFSSSTLTAVDPSRWSSPGLPLHSIFSFGCNLPPLRQRQRNDRGRSYGQERSSQQASIRRGWKGTYYEDLAKRVS